jgi:hypothetical protein
MNKNSKIALQRVKNKLLLEALAAIKETANKELQKKYDLVWYARYRCKSNQIMNFIKIK